MATASETYLLNEVFSASPQKLQLLLLEGAVRFASRALESWRRQDENGAMDNLLGGQRIMVQLLTRLRYDLAPALVDQVGRVYLFIYRSLVLAQVNRDSQQVMDALRVLEIERDTWRQLCRHLADAGVESQGPVERLELNA